MTAKFDSKDKGTCCIVDQFCLSPANLEVPNYIRTRCYSCGDFVCANCSSIIKYGIGRQRLCNYCQIQNDGNDEKVMKRLRALAKIK